MPVTVHHVEARILYCLADGDVLQLLAHLIGSDITDALRGTVAVNQQIWRRRDVGKFFSTREKDLQRVVFHIVHKLPSHLRGHKAMRDVVLLKVIVQHHEVKAHLLGDDIYGGTDSKRSP